MPRLIAVLLAAAALAAALLAPSARADSLSASAGTVAATLTWQKKLEGTAAGPAKLVITRGGTPAFTGRGNRCSLDLCDIPMSPNEDPALRVVDLDGDGEPEVTVDTYSGGAHCCFTTRVLRWDGSARYRAVLHEWYDAGYELKDLDGNGTLEFVSNDARFAYAFASYADSFLPVQVMAFDADRFSDVTPGHLDLVRTERKRLARILAGRRRRGSRDTAGVLAAYAADTARVDGKAAARRAVLSFAPHADVTKGMARDILRALKKWGYL